MGTAPTEAVINGAYQILSERVKQIEYLIGYEGNAFAFTGNVEEDLLSITAVRPMRQEAVSDFLARAGAGWSVVQELIVQGKLVETEYGGQCPTGAIHMEEQHVASGTVRRRVLAPFFTRVFLQGRRTLENR